MKMKISVLLSVLVAGQSTLACMCYSELTKEEALSKSATVVLAKVVSADATSIELPRYKRSVQATKFTLETTAQFKGDAQSRLEILTRQSCRAELEPGAEYVIYLNSSNNGNLPEVSACDRIVSAENAKEDLEYLKGQ